jgi:hypothetical protein
MRSYDGVLVPIGFGDTERNLTEFNIATKLSECLASGTVTLVYGPPFAAMVRLLHGPGAAHVMTERALSEWPDVAAAVRDAATRRRVLNGAREFVRRHASSGIMRERWRAAIEKL